MAAPFWFEYFHRQDAEVCCRLCGLVLTCLGDGDRVALQTNQKIPMKLPKIVLTTCIALAFAVVGCNKQSNTVDTTPIEKSFSSADPATKSTADTVVSEIKSANYSGAVTDLQKLASNAKLTPEQQQAIKDVVAQLRTALGDTASKAADGANKTATDLQNSLPKK